jgi:hypothetical protein
MTELTLTLPDTIIERLRSEASEHNLTIEMVIHAAIDRYFMDDDSPTKQDILDSISESMRDAPHLLGQTCR